MDHKNIGIKTQRWHETRSCVWFSQQLEARPLICATQMVLNRLQTTRMRSEWWQQRARWTQKGENWAWMCTQREQMSQWWRNKAEGPEGCWIPKTTTRWIYCVRGRRARQQQHNRKRHWERCNDLLLMCEWLVVGVSPGELAGGGHNNHTTLTALLSSSPNITKINCECGQWSKLKFQVKWFECWLQWKEQATPSSSSASQKCACHWCNKVPAAAWRWGGAWSHCVSPQWSWQESGGWKDSELDDFFQTQGWLPQLRATCLGSILGRGVSCGQRQSCKQSGNPSQLKTSVSFGNTACPWWWSSQSS